MPATAPRELMVLVERVIRPLPLPLPRQKRLRTELLAHLQAVHAEELARDDDAAAALRRTQQRFGDPAELTVELRGTIRWWEQWLARYQRTLAQRPAESLLRYTFRLVGQFTLILTFLMALIVVSHHAFGTEPISWLKVRVSGAAVVFLAVWLGGFLLFGLPAGEEWERPQRRWSRLALYTLGQIGVWALSLIVLMALAGGGWFDYAQPLRTSILGGMLSVICGVVVGVFHHRDMQYYREWAELPVDAA